jgi:hypothetical protein
VPGFDGGDAEGDEDVLLPVPAGPIRHTFSDSRIHSSDDR